MALLNTSEAALVQEIVDLPIHYYEYEKVCNNEITALNPIIESNLITEILLILLSYSDYKSMKSKEREPWLECLNTCLEKITKLDPTKTKIKLNQNHWLANCAVSNKTNRSDIAMDEYIEKRLDTTLSLLGYCLELNKGMFEKYFWNFLEKYQNAANAIFSSLFLNRNLFDLLEGQNVEENVKKLFDIFEQHSSRDEVKKY